MKKGSAGRRRATHDPDNVQHSDSCSREDIAAKAVTLSRKLRRKLNDSQEQSVDNETMKRRKRNCKTPVDDTKTELSLDCNQNTVRCGARSSKSDTTTEVLSNEQCNNTKTDFDEKQLTNLDPFQRDLIVNGLGQRDKVPEIKGCNDCSKRAQNMLRYFQQFTYGNRCRLELRKVLKDISYF